MSVASGVKCQIKEGLFGGCKDNAVGYCQYCARLFCAKHALVLEPEQQVCNRKNCVAKWEDLQVHLAYKDVVVRAQRGAELRHRRLRRRELRRVCALHGVLLPAARGADGRGRAGQQGAYEAHGDAVSALRASAGRSGCGGRFRRDRSGSRALAQDPVRLGYRRADVRPLCERCRDAGRLFEGGAPVGSEALACGDLVGVPRVETRGMVSGGCAWRSGLSWTPTLEDAERYVRWGVRGRWWFLRSRLT